MEKTLLQTILNANVAYREGKPVMSDQEFDDLCERAEKEMSPKEWYLFRNSLHEKAGKIQHPFIMGSLDKVKMEDEKSLKSFISKHVKNSLNISAKVDGISCRLEYRDGKLVGASSRGDGCLSYDSTLIFEDGRKIPIGTVCELKIEGKILSYNEKTKRNEFKEILHHNIQNSKKQWFKITLEDNSFINVTEDHLIFTDRGWIQAKDLLPSDNIKTL